MEADPDTNYLREASMPLAIQTCEMHCLMWAPAVWKVWWEPQLDTGFL